MRFSLAVEHRGILRKHVTENQNVLSAAENSGAAFSSDLPGPANRTKARLVSAWHDERAEGYMCSVGRIKGYPTTRFRFNRRRTSAGAGLFLGAIYVTTLLLVHFSHRRQAAGLSINTIRFS